MTFYKSNYFFYFLNEKKFVKLIYNLNSSIESRKFSIKKNFFSYSNHKKWLALVLKNKKESIFIIKFKKKTIGILREKCIKKKNYLSWVIKEKFRGKNHGKKMLKAFISLSKKKYYAKIHKNNFASLKICKSAGFKEYSKYNGFITFKK